MTVSELKKKLIIEINSIENQIVLEEMYRMIGKKDFDNNVYNLSNEQRIAVEESKSKSKNRKRLS